MFPPWLAWWWGSSARSRSGPRSSSHPLRILRWTGLASYAAAAAASGDCSYASSRRAPTRRRPPTPAAAATHDPAGREPPCSCCHRGW
jgi:hypothetical protein